MPFRPLTLLTALLLTPPQSGNSPGAPIAAPGLAIPDGALPWALDHFEGKPELVPIHHSEVQLNSHKGLNIAGSLAGPIYRPKTTVELAGAHARTVLHDPTPSIYIHLLDDPDGSGPAGSDQSSTTFAIVQAVSDPRNDRRVLAQITYTQLSGDAKRKDGIVETTDERLPGGWWKITPIAPLLPGEYALNPIPKAQNSFSTTVFDFTLDPAGPNAADAVHPTEP